MMLTVLAEPEGCAAAGIPAKNNPQEARSNRTVRMVMFLWLN
jgi:hypothetical protein